MNQEFPTVKSLRDMLNLICEKSPTKGEEPLYFASEDDSTIYKVSVDLNPRSDKDGCPWAISLQGIKSFEVFPTDHPLRLHKTIPFDLGEAFPHLCLEIDQEILEKCRQVAKMGLKK